jgi:transcription elongation factor GreA
MMEQAPMTKAGYDKLRAQLEDFENTRMPDLTKKLAEARAEGDLKENAEYHALREEQGHLQARINMLRDKLARAQVIDPATLPRDQVTFGSTVKLLDLDFEDEETYTLVGETEDDPDNGRILANSPLAQGLLGAKVGQTVEIDVPAGKVKFKILEISNES